MTDIAPSAPSESGVNIAAIPRGATHVVTTATGQIGFTVPGPGALEIAASNVANYVKSNGVTIGTGFAALVIGALASHAHLI